MTTRVFGERKDDWAARTGRPTEADGAAWHAEIDGKIGQVEAEAQAKADQVRAELAQAKAEAVTQQEAVQSRNQELADQLGLRFAKSDAERAAYLKEHDPGGPKTSSEAQAELDALGADDLSIYEEYVNPTDKTFGKQDRDYTDQVTIDPTDGLRDLDDEALAAAANDYDPFANVAKPSSTSGADDSTSTVGMTKADVVHLDFQVLRNLANRCAQINAAFQKSTASDHRAAWSAGTRVCRGYTGRAGDVVNDFYTNWKIRRGKFRETAEAYGKNARIVIQNFTRYDIEIAAKARRQEAVLIESKRRALAHAEQQPTKETPQIAPPILELQPAEVEFIGQKHGIALTGGMIGSGLALQVEGAWAPYSEAVDQDFVTGDYTPDGTFSPTLDGEAPQVQKDLAAAGIVDLDFSTPAIQLGPISSDGRERLGELTAWLGEIVRRRGPIQDGYPSGTMHAVLGGPRGFATTPPTTSAPAV